ncbi:hypothetical protein [Halomarina ordinaria]|uniref:Glycosyltransferase RgtA/B/C/D-like domain-containing protein n=1 Tax=Halomarina ordinaria TaxID=3033939 RepID=A0ABD5U6H0_9EURY|nr:hypothetical protein [Halomarina sp. PSRA2]
MNAVGVLGHRRAGTVLSLLFVVLAVVGVTVPYVVGLGALSLLGVYIAVPLVAVAALYWSRVDASAVERLDTTRFRLLVGAYFLCLGVSILLLGVAPVRPFAYYGVVAVASTLVFAQIPSAESAERTVAVLLQTVLLTLSLVWGVAFKYNYYFARTDVFPHAWYTEVLLASGEVTTTFDDYRAFPLWHLLGASEDLLSGVGWAPRYYLFLTSGLVFGAVAVGVYLLAMRLFDSRRIALTAAWLTPLNTFVLQYATEAIPRSVTSFLGIGLFLAMLSRGRAFRALFGLFALGIVVYHPVTVPFLFVIVGVFYGAQRLVPGTADASLVRLSDVGILLAVQVVYWVGWAPYIVEHVVENVRSTGASGGTTGVTNSGILASPLGEVANYVQFSFLVLFVGYALVVCVSKRDVPPAGVVTVVAAALLSTLSFPGPLLFLQSVSENFNVFRFGQYTYPLISVAAGAGLVWLTRSRFRWPSSRHVMRGFVLLLVLSMSFTAVSNDFVASDNPVVERQFYTFYLSESEQDGLETLVDVTPGLVMADYISCRYLTYSPHTETCHILEVDPEAGRVFFGGESNLVVVRDGELRDRGAIQLFPTTEFVETPSYDAYLTYVDRESPVWEDLADRNKVYATDDVEAYAASGRAENRE